MQSIVQSLLLIILPLLGLILPGTLKQDKFSPLANSIISGVVVVLVSIATAYTKDQFGPNFFIDAGIVLAGISALLGGPLRGLDAFLQSNVLALIQQQMPTLIQAVSALNTSTTQSNALIHITTNTVHIPTVAPVPATPEPTVTVPDVTPVPDPVEAVQESSGVGAIVGDATPVATGVTTPEDANDKTQKMSVVKATTPLTG